MKRSSQKSGLRLWCGTIGVALLFLVIGPQTAEAQTNTFPTTGNAGIGTTTPGSLLEVKQSQNAGTTVVIDNGHTAASNVAFSGLFFKQAGVNRFYLGSINDGNTTQIGGAGGVQFWNYANGPILFATNNAERMRIDATGNVGIGTSTPASLLHVASESLAAVRGIVNAQHSPESFSPIFTFRKSRGTKAAPAVALNGDNIGNLVAEAYDGATYIIGGRIRFAIDGPVASGSVPTAVQFFSGASASGIERMRISSSGNVGIGTTAPNYSLEIQGASSRNTLALTGDGDSAGYAGIKIQALTTTGIATNRTSQFNLHMRKGNWYGGDGSGPSFIIETISKTGGYAAPFVITPTNDIILNSGVGNSGLSYGNVGIGKTAPVYKLDVNGEINATGLRINGTPIVTGGASQWTTAASNIHFNTGNVGIGTMTPTSKVHVVSGTDSSTTLLNLDTGIHGGTSMGVFGTVNNESGFDMSVYRGGQYFSRFGVSTAGNVYLQPGAGNVGIGTATPSSALDVRAVSAGISTTSTTGTNRAYVGTINTGGSVLMGSESSAGQSIFNAGTLPYAGVFGTTGARPVQLVTNQTARMTIDASGNVGIGIASPTKKLDVVGDINASGAITGGSINAKYQDVAEWVESSQALAAGTVVVLDHTRSNQVIASSRAYDTRVAGVISLQPGIALGESGAGKVLVATTGRVRIKVDASAGPIQIGDLLVTSDVPGVAMKSEAIKVSGRLMHMPGTLIGKALEPLEQGSAKILVLLSLQ